jgi:hypothetical protein
MKSGRRDVAGELLFVEAGVAPGDVPVVHLVRDAEVPEAAEEVLLHALDEVAAVDEVLLAQGEEVAAVGALRGGGEAEEELRAEVGDAKASRGKRSRWAPGPDGPRAGSGGRCPGTAGSSDPSGPRNDSPADGGGLFRGVGGALGWKAAQGRVESGAGAGAIIAWKRGSSRIDARSTS